MRDFLAVALRLALAGAALAPAALFADRVTTGELEVRLYTPPTLADDEATGVVVTGPGLVRAREMAIEGLGPLVFLSLPPGVYEVETVPGAGYRPGTAEVRVGERTRVVLEAIDPIYATVTVDYSEGVLGGSMSGVRPQAEELERLPISRDYRAFTQVVPGVTVVPNASGTELPIEPSSKAGNNYHDRGARPGSQDNTYTFDGFDFTGIASGQGDVAFHAGVIAEQQVVTAGVPAEMPGGAGMVVNVLTRSGGPQLAGSAEVYLLDSSMYSSYDTDDQRLHLTREDRVDAGLTFGGPLVKDRLWFFAAGQDRRNDDEVALSPSASPTPASTIFELIRRNTFGKLSYAPAPGRLVIAAYYHEPRETRGTRNPNVPLLRYSRGKDTFSLGSLRWQSVLGGRHVVEAQAGRFDRVTTSVPEFPEAGPSNTIVFAPGVIVPAWQRQLGSSGASGRTDTERLQVGAQLSSLLGIEGQHRFSVGLQYHEWEEATGTTSPFDATLTSLARGLSGLTFGDARALGLLPPTEFDAILRALRANPTSAAFRTTDANGDGLVTEAELAAQRFGSTRDNQGGVNFLRTENVALGVNAIRQEAPTAFVEDEWRAGRWTLSGGLRIERRSYFASDGSTILEMDPDWLPRLGVAYDLTGRGRHLLSLAYGEYVDPLRTSMVRFAGNLTGSIFGEQVFLGDTWFTYRTRGSAVLNRDAGFAPNLRNSREQDTTLAYRLSGGRLQLVAQAYHRRDRHIVEDYDPSYFNPAVAGDLTLSPGDFGYGPEGPVGVNYFLANLVGAKRRAYGVDLGLDYSRDPRARISLQYSWKRAKGNSNSDEAADLQGDFLALDPRQPYMDGWLPGTIEHQVKLIASGRVWRGLDVGVVGYWSGGARYTEATIFRPTTHGIYYNFQRPDGSFVRTGDERQPSWWKTDLRLAYTFDTSRRFTLRATLDVYNVFDNQDVYLIEGGHNDPEFAFGEAKARVEPRHWQVGLRMTF